MVDLSPKNENVTNLPSLNIGHIENGKKVATPLLVALLFIEVFDLIFAVDSVPVNVYKIPTVIALATVAGILSLSIVLSI